MYECSSGLLHRSVLGQSYRDHDDVVKWKHFPRYWPFVRGIHRSPVNSPHKGQWCVALMFSLICVWINGCVNNLEAVDLRRYRAHYDVIVMQSCDYPRHRKLNIQASNANPGVVGYSSICRALKISLIYARTKGNWVNTRDAGDLSRHCAHYDVTIMIRLRKTNRQIPQIPQYTRPIFRIYWNVPISVPNGPFWDIGQVHCEIAKSIYSGSRQKYIIYYSVNFIGVSCVFPCWFSCKSPNFVHLWNKKTHDIFSDFYAYSHDECSVPGVQCVIGDGFVPDDKTDTAMSRFGWAKS